MFDALQDDMAENEAEIHVLRRQISEVDIRLGHLSQEEKSTRQRLQISNDEVSQSLEDMFKQLKERVPAADLPIVDYEALKQEIQRGEDDLKEVENLVLDHIKWVSMTFWVLGLFICNLLAICFFFCCCCAST
jgi:chromosome segregation ATPase